MRHAGLRAVGAAVALAVVASCAPDRPAMDDWAVRFARVVDALPAEQDMVQDPSRTVCNETLGFLRSNRADLTPTPDLSVDDAVETWINIAESAFFECPPSSGEIDGFAEAYRELDRLEAEIDAALGTDVG